MLYVGALMTSFWAVLEGRPEVGAACIGIASALSQQTVWFMPLYTLLVLYTVIGRNMPAFGGVNAQSMTELNAYFSILT